MPRVARLFQPGAAYHLISRFVDREWFIQRESEREHYLRLLARAIHQSDWRLLAFAIMSNHIHLAVVAGLHKLETWIRSVHSPFAGTMNRMYDRIGGIFVRGPKSLAIEAGAVGQVIAYIHNNPVRAGLCDAPSESTWTSHRDYVGKRARPRWLDVTEGMRLSGFCDPSSFDAWVSASERSSFDVEYGGYVDRLDEEDNPDECFESVRESHLVFETEPERIVAATAKAIGVPVRQLCSSSRGHEEVLGRALAVRVATEFGIPGSRIAAALQISQQRASVLRRMELANEHEPVRTRIINAVTHGNHSLK